MAVRKAAAGKTRTVHIQDPGGDSRAYDLVIVPAHDDMRGDNVLVSRGALHRVNARRLAAEAGNWRSATAHLPRPLVAVLVGGSNRHYRMDAPWARHFGAQLVAMARAKGCGLLVTPSRRTPPGVMAEIEAALKDLPAVLWNGKGDNPYFGYLALADTIIATCDSVSMISEALSTGKPVLLARLAGASRRFQRFFDALERDGFIRWFDGALEAWPNAKFDDMGAIAEQVWERLKPV